MSVFWRPRGCVLWFDFGEPIGGIAYDLSGVENSGVIYGASRVSGPLSGALSFDGVDDYVEVPHDPSIDFNTSFSTEVLMRTTADAGAPLGKQMGVPPYTGYYLGMGRTVAGRVDFVHIDVGGNVRYVTSRTVNDGKWHCLHGIVRNLTIEVWTDGELDAATGILSQDVRNPEALRVGCVRQGVYHWSGSIALVRIYNRALAQREIRAHYYYLTRPMARVPEGKSAPS